MAKKHGTLPQLRPVSTGALTSTNSHLPADIGRDMSDINEGSQSDAGGPMDRPSTPAVKMPAPDHTPDQSASVPPVPNSLNLLPQHYQTGENADLKIVSNGVERSVHKVVVCSQSPVIKQECSNEWVSRVELNQYDPETLERVLDFCYRRTYSDGEYPETAAPSIFQMTADDIRVALEAPLAVASDVECPRWRGLCFQFENSEGGKDEEENPEVVDKQAEKETRKNPEDKYVPKLSELDDSDDNYHCSDDEMPLIHVPLIHVPLTSQELAEPQQPPYTISLFANLKVYTAAKELQIPALQLLARKRFAHTLRAHWARFEHFPALIQQVYLRTENGDHLRALICQIVAADYDERRETDFKAELRELMGSNGEFATDVLDTALQMRSEWKDGA